MQQQIKHSHHRYIFAEENLMKKKKDEIEVFVFSVPCNTCQIGVHIDDPLYSKEFNDNSIIEGKRQLYIQLSDLL